MKYLVLVSIVVLNAACGEIKYPDSKDVGSLSDITGTYQLSNIAKDGVADATCQALPVEISVTNYVLSVSERTYQCGMVTVDMSEYTGIKIVGNDLYAPDGIRKVGTIGKTGPGTMTLTATAEASGIGCSVNFYISKVTTNGVSKTVLYDEVTCPASPSAKYISDISK